MDLNCSWDLEASPGKTLAIRICENSVGTYDDLFVLDIDNGAKTPTRLNR